MRLELVKLSIAVAILRRSDARLPDVDLEIDESRAEETDVYIGSRTGTRLRSLSRLILPGSKTNTQLSDFLHAIVPLIYLSSSGGWKKRTRWTSWLLALLVEMASILALPESNKTEKRVRIRRLVIESILRQPMFDVTLNPPGRAISNLWNKIPLLRDLNYLEYYLYGHRKYFYFHQ
jgi:hypothetical protein